MSENIGDNMSTTRTEVSVRGRFVGLSIIGSTVIACIVMENFGLRPLAELKWWLAGGLALGVALPMLFFRRPIGR
jgi:hypothetical protein